MIPLEQILAEKDKLSMVSAKTLGRLIFQKMFSPKDLGINYRTIVHWDEKGILSLPGEKREGNRWRKFSFVEIVWIDLLEEVRSLGYGISQILEVKKYLYDPLSIEEAILSVKVPPTKLENELLKQSPSSVELVEKFRTKRPNELRLKDPVNRLAPAILLQIIAKRDTHYHFYPDGDYLEFVPSKDNLSQEELNKTHISVSLATIMGKYLQREPELENAFTLMSLTKEEIQVLYYIRSEKIETLKIKFDKNHSIDLIETTRSKKVSLESRFLEHVTKGAYQEIVVKTQKGKIESFKMVTKHKIKK